MIDEKKLLEVMERWKRGGIEEHEQSAFNLAIDLIKIQPKTGEWISIDEKKPKSYENVLIYTKGAYAFRIGSYFEEYKRWWLGSYWENLDFVLAWQPLPEPYEVKNDD